jgi:hypothetical protein
MLKKEDLLSVFTPEDLNRIETAARAANKEPKDWLKELVVKATNLAEPQTSVVKKETTERSAEVESNPRTSLKLERIERDWGIVRLHVRLLEGAVKLSRGCTFGDARLRTNNEDTRFLKNETDSQQFTFVLATPTDASHFEEGKTYEFKGLPLAA